MGLEQLDALLMNVNRVKKVQTLEELWWAYLVKILVWIAFMKSWLVESLSKHLQKIL